MTPTARGAAERSVGIGNPKIEEALTLHLPQGTVIVPAGKDEYLAFLMAQPFIQTQVQSGIYEPAHIHEEMLTVAWSWPPRLVAVCFDLIRWHMASVPLIYGFRWVEAVAIHEAYHLEHHQRRTRSTQEQIDRERECNEALEAHYPEIAAMAAEADRLSPTISRVTQRARLLRAREGVQS